MTSVGPIGRRRLLRGVAGLSGLGVLDARTARAGESRNDIDNPAARSEQGRAATRTDGSPSELVGPAARWSHTYGNDRGERIDDVIETDDGGFLLVGRGRPEDENDTAGLVVRTDAAGRKRWTRYLDGGRLRAIARLGDGVVVGDHRGRVTRLDETGARDWTVSDRPDEGVREIGAVVRDGAGVAVAGVVDSPVDETVGIVGLAPDGRQRWRGTIDVAGDAVPTALVPAVDGDGFLVGGYREHVGDREGWIARVGPDGRHWSTRTYDGDDRETIVAVVPVGENGSGGGASRGYFLAGSTETWTADSDRAGWLLRVDVDGAIRWNRSIDPGGDSTWIRDAAPLAETPADPGTPAIATDGVVLAGYTTPTDADRRGWLVAVDADGTLRWSRTYGDDDSDRDARAVIAVADGSHVVAGAADRPVRREGPGGGTTTYARTGTWLAKIGGPNEPPRAAVRTDPETPAVGETVTFSGAESTDDDGSVAEYAWDLDADAGFEATGERVEHVFEAAEGTPHERDGRYPVRLRATDDDGGTDAAETTVTTDRAVPAPETIAERTLEADDDVFPTGVGSGSSFAAVAGFTRPTDDEGEPIEDVPTTAWLRGVVPGRGWQWRHEYEASDDSHIATAVAAVGGGFVYGGPIGPLAGDVAGAWLASVDATGTERWSRTVDAAGVAAVAPAEKRAKTGGERATDGSGSATVVAGRRARGPEAKDVGWIARIDRGGRTTWERTFDTPDRVSDATVLDDGTVLAAGSADADGEGRLIVVVRLDVDGSVHDRRTYGDPGTNPETVLADDGRLLAINRSTATFSAWTRLLGLDGDGTVDWRRTITGRRTTDVTAAPADSHAAGGHVLAVRRGGESPAAGPVVGLLAVDAAGSTVWEDDRRRRQRGPEALARAPGAPGPRAEDSSRSGADPGAADRNSRPSDAKRADAFDLVTVGTSRQSGVGFDAWLRLCTDRSVAAVAKPLTALAHAGDSVVFDGTASVAAEGAIDRYRWDLDDSGSFARDGSRVRRRFDTPGSHTVALEVTDATGSIAVDRRTVTVLGPPTTTAIDREAIASRVTTPHPTETATATTGDESGGTIVERLDDPLPAVAGTMLLGGGLLARAAARRRDEK